MADDKQPDAHQQLRAQDAPPKEAASEAEPMALDKAGLQSFLENRVLPFQEQVRKIQMNDPGIGPSMNGLIGEADVSPSSSIYGLDRPLAMGFMADDSYLEGQGAKLQKAVAGTAENLQSVFEQQAQLFDDIGENLRDTIHRLFNAQHQNLQSINGQKLMDIFDDVDEDLSSTSSDSGDTESI